MLAAIDIRKAVFLAAVLDVQSGSLVESRFANTREELSAWIKVDFPRFSIADGLGVGAGEVDAEDQFDRRGHAAVSSRPASAGAAASGGMSRRCA